MHKSQNEVFRTQTRTHVDNSVPDQSPDQSAQISVYVPLQSTVKKNKTRFLFFFRSGTNLVPRAMPVRGLGLALALGKRNEIRNFIGCREINNLGAA